MNIIIFQSFAKYIAPCLLVSMKQIYVQSGSQASRSVEIVVRNSVFRRIFDGRMLALSPKPIDIFLRPLIHLPTLSL